MTDSLVPRTSTLSGLVPADLMERAREYARASKSPATLRAYATVWRNFGSWCDRRGLVAMPASQETVVAYVVEQAERLRPQTVKKHLAAISQMHQLAGEDSPVQSTPVRLVMQGLRRTKGVASQPKKALRVSHLKSMVAVVPDTDVGIRDRALLLLGFAAGMRRSELVGLNVEDLDFQPEGIVATIKRSKRDQEGRGRQVAVPRGRYPGTCPVRAVQRWLDVSGIKSGPLFVRLDRATEGRSRLSGRSVALIVKKAADQAGLDPEMFAGHSLRRGFCTETARAGAAERDIARTTGHSSLAVLRGYVEAGQLFERCAAQVLDL
jgi:site-specific recombinase XerD